MAHGVNKVTLLGNLGKNPKIHSTDTNKLIVILSLATTDSYKDKAGTWIKQTQWHYITLFNRLAKIARDHLKKGAKVYIEGRLKTQKWKDKEGNEQITLSIIANELQMLTKGKGELVTPEMKSQEDFDSDITF
ncbi:single-stranded DNA-binding protein [Rickettsiella endosymbiont of Dermanyssus gallinae]|uniref:single-stranded DNA-binding protein n=1 Tax=Rickettsiella endosymbiont of Dermanyssus gallinae TaxID=2856608 RepID=UPI001C52B068|nr:single-stranded DNA-binding protein [Rickettsiella endosymbiont of Dermanyssus gallinae]